MELVAIRLLHIYNAVYYINTKATPRQSTLILAVMHFEILAAVGHHLLGNFFVGYRKLELVRLYAARLSRFNAALDDLAFVGLKKIAFLHYIVKVA